MIRRGVPSDARAGPPEASARIRTSLLDRPQADRQAEPSKGLRDLLWALLNTKEFITNH